MLYPLIALSAVFFLCHWFPERALMSRPFSSVYVFFAVPAMIFGFAGIRHLIKAFIFQRNIQSADGELWVIPLAAGVLLNAVLIVAVIWVSVGDYNLRQSKKRYNVAVNQIHQIHYFIIDYLAIPTNDLPSEDEGLEMLRSQTSTRFPDNVSLIDPWGKPYGYRLRENYFYVWSAGPDGLDNTDDDIDINNHRFRWYYWHWPAP